jgi:hypothetical protein
LDEKMIQSFDEARLRLDSATLEMRGRLEALKRHATETSQSTEQRMEGVANSVMEIQTDVHTLEGQSAGIKQSFKQSFKRAEQRFGEAADTIQDELKALREQRTKINQSMEQAKMRASLVAIVSKGGTLVLTALRYVEEHDQKIFNWLAAPDHESKHRNTSNMRQGMTGSWFLEDKWFQEWRGTPRSFLWLHGIRESAKKHDSALH